MIRLQRPTRTEAQLRALAASGASGLARAAQAELRALMIAKLQGEARGRS